MTPLGSFPLQKGKQSQHWIFAQGQIGADTSEISKEWTSHTQNLFPLPKSSSAHKCWGDRNLSFPQGNKPQMDPGFWQEEGIVLIRRISCLPSSICVARQSILGWNHIVLSWAGLFIGILPGGLPFKCHRISNKLIWRKRQQLSACIVTREQRCTSSILGYVFMFKAWIQVWDVRLLLGKKSWPVSEGWGKMCHDGTENLTQSVSICCRITI